ncbi:MAG: alpha-L-rhamnosidase N-terminal domain-containing protein, partial [Clostridia bacterium]|nr:alpha-L-rhamnosidase N-terminal domain-containing protein [Clostridia bacterium]
MKVINLSVENKTKNIVTDEARPRFSFGIRSDGRNVTLKEAIIKAGEWSAFVNEQILIPYGGAPLKPYSDYTLSVSATDSDGNTDRAELVFSTGRMGQPWTAKWITDGEYKFTEKRVSPTPMVFRKRISLKGEVASAKVYSTAMGVYELSLDGKKIGEDYFAPGFTSYKTNLQYQVYDITAEIKD